jgi:hypothetical protein
MPIYTLPRYAVLGRRFALRAMLPPADTPRLAFAGSFGSGVFIHRSEVGCKATAEALEVQNKPSPVHKATGASLACLR